MQNPKKAPLERWLSTGASREHPRSTSAQVVLPKSSLTTSRVVHLQEALLALTQVVLGSWAYKEIHMATGSHSISIQILI
jgi:hypothetical protein